MNKKIENSTERSESKQWSGLSEGSARLAMGAVSKLRMLAGLQSYRGSLTEEGNR